MAAFDFSSLIAGGNAGAGAGVGGLNDITAQGAGLGFGGGGSSGLADEAGFKEMLKRLFGGSEDPTAVLQGLLGASQGAQGGSDLVDIGGGLRAFVPGSGGGGLQGAIAGGAQGFLKGKIAEQGRKNRLEDAIAQIKLKNEQGKKRSLAKALEKQAADQRRRSEILAGKGVKTTEQLRDQVRAEKDLAAENIKSLIRDRESGGVDKSARRTLSNIKAKAALEIQRLGTTAKGDLNRITREALGLKGHPELSPTTEEKAFMIEKIKDGTLQNVPPSLQHLSPGILTAEEGTQALASPVLQAGDSGISAALLGGTPIPTARNQRSLRDRIKSSLIRRR